MRQASDVIRRTAADVAAVKAPDRASGRRPGGRPIRSLEFCTGSAARFLEAWCSSETTDTSLTRDEITAPALDGTAGTQS